MSRQDSAHALALQALAFIVSEPETAGGFLAQGGLSPDELAARAGDPDLLAAVMDFILSEDRLVLDFAAAAGVAPEKILSARAALPGGDAPHWT